MVIKYSEEGKIKWAEGIGGTYIKSVTETADGGYIVGGYFNSSSIDLGNGISLTNKGSINSYDGMIIKLDKIELPNPTVIQAQRIGG